MKTGGGSTVHQAPSKMASSCDIIMDLQNSTKISNYVLLAHGFFKWSQEQLIFFPVTPVLL